MSSTAIQFSFLETVKSALIKNTWYSYGCIYKKYQHVAFLSKVDAVDFLAMFSPFDIFTAGFFFGSVLALVLVLSYIVLLKNKSFINISNFGCAFCSVIWYPIKSIFEQGDHSGLIKSCKNR